MLPFRKIVLPVDDSDPCQKVVPYAKEFMHRFSAEVTLVHAYGAEALAYSDLALTDPSLPEQARSAEEERLQQFACKMFPADHVERVVGLGEPGTVIDSVIQRQGADLVMLATHGRGPLRRFLLGSVTTKVLHDVSTAVWTATAPVLTERAPRIPYKSILCAVDGTEEAEGVLRAAAAFAHAYSARLSILHILETPATSLEIDFTPYKEGLMEAANFRLRELKAELGIEAPHAVIDGFVSGTIHREALRTEADLIVTGRGRAQGALTRLWSHLYPIVREAPCPVLSI